MSRTETSSFDFEGFTESDRLPQSGVLISTLPAEQSLVWTTLREEFYCSSSSSSSVIPGSQGESLLGTLLSELRPSRVDFLRKVYSS